MIILPYLFIKLILISQCFHKIIDFGAQQYTILVDLNILTVYCNLLLI